MSGMTEEASIGRVICDVETLTKIRPGRIRDRLRPLSGRVLAVDPKSGYQQVVIAVRYGTPASHNVTEWTFPSISESIRCHYLERWRNLGDDDEAWELERVHFHLLQHRGASVSRGEIVLFHWQPRAGEDVGGPIYARRPHLHVNSKEIPLNKAHVAVNLAPPGVDQISVQYLDELLDEVVTMLKVEILERLGNATLA